MSGKRNPRQISSARLEAAIKYNRKWARHFSNIYSYPDWQELESIGLKAISACCLKVKSTRRQKGFISLCRVSVHNAVVDYLRKSGRVDKTIAKVKARVIKINQDQDRYMPDETEE